MNETVKKQKRLQVNVSPALAEQSQNIFQKLGLITQGCLNDLFLSRSLRQRKFHLIFK